MINKKNNTPWAPLEGTAIFEQHITEIVNPKTSNG